jgi:hypothetical protein
MKVHSDKAKKVVPNVILSEASHPGLILSGHVQFIAYVSTMLGTGTGWDWLTQFLLQML